MYKEKLHISEINETYSQLNCDKGVLWELCERFKFLVDNAKYHPLVKNKIWDGYIKHVNYQKGTIYKGFVSEIVKYCLKNNIECTIDSSFKNFVSIDIQNFIQSINLKFSPYDHQVNAIKQAIEKNRRIILSPTGSGKSLIMYCIMRYYTQDSNHTPLFVVPFKSLVDQLPTEFINYNENYDFLYCKIYEGEETYFYKNQKIEKEEIERISFQKQIPIVYFATWQSIYKRKKVWFEQFDSIFGDEVHRFVAKSLQTMMEKIPHCKYRFGFTGTLNEAKTNEFTLVGLFGPVYNCITAKELIDKDILSQMEINCFVLNYDKETKKEFREYRKDYHKEIEMLCKNEKRNNFILKLGQKASKTSLFLFNRVEDHGKLLFELFRKNIQDKNIFFVYGGTPNDYRNHVKMLIDCDEQIILDFEEFQLHCSPKQQVPLSDGNFKLAEEIDITDDIDDDFLKKFSSINNFK